MEARPHLETLRTIRRITADGVLTMEEVWDLAGFLNEDRDARSQWPGNVLWPTLESIFDDGVVDDEEMEVLGAMLSDISLQIAKMDDLRLTTYIRTRSRESRLETAQSNAA
jgi:hypothetical protein